MIQVYTGNGKGKTTAALGLALRAAGCGLKVYIGQFAKAGQSGELRALKKIKNIKIEQLGGKCFIKRPPSIKDLESARKGMEKIREVICGGRYNVIIMDEINIALKLKLLKTADLLRLIKKAPKKVELVLTGRYAHPKIIEAADLVSRLEEVKHYFRRGVKARRGIEY